jgi:hypothetical protein
MQKPETFYFGDLEQGAIFYTVANSRIVRWIKFDTPLDSNAIATDGFTAYLNDKDEVWLENEIYKNRK